MSIKISILSRIWHAPDNQGSRLKSVLQALLMHIHISVLRKEWIFKWKAPLTLKIRKGYHSLTAQVYFGLSEYEEMSFLLERLKPEDYFVDVGANLGVYTLLAAGVCRAKVLAIEPWPENVAILKEQVKLNRLEEQVEILQAGASDLNGVLLFQSDSSQNTFVLSADNSDSGSAISAPVYRIDSILKKCPHYIKIDVEGHEMQVLKGLGEFLDNPVLRVIQCETIADKNDVNLRQIWQLLLSKDFISFKYDPGTKSLIEIGMGERANTLFVRGGMIEQLI